jgi:predicted metal-dependent HD superfamily phosphohydrolase
MDLSKMLKDIFTELVSRHSKQPEIAENLWADIEKQYAGSKRYYHNLDHLQNMYRQLETCREQVEDWDTVLFSLFYHDIIYKVTAKDNEEKSALAAIKALTAINYPKEKIKRCAEQILATKSHEISADSDTNLFTDADMAIVGVPESDYTIYSKLVRREYAIFPDFMYNPGRKKVLQHFLAMEQIFKTPHFKEKFEVQARENLQAELDTIQ